MDGDNIKFKKSIENATVEIINRTTKRMEKACLLVEAEAKLNCPVDEGILRASINSEVRVNEKAIVGYIGSNIDYAPYVHEGTGIYARNGKGRKTPWVWIGYSKKWRGRHYTRGQKPKPFLTNALQDNKGKINKILKG